MKNPVTRLKWVPVSCDDQAFFGDTKGFISLEEVDDVQVEYVESAVGGKTLHLKPVSEEPLKPPGSLVKSKRKQSRHVQDQNVLDSVDNGGVASKKRKRSSTCQHDVHVVHAAVSCHANGWIVSNSACRDVSNGIPLNSKLAVIDVQNAASAEPLMQNSPVDVSAWEQFHLHPLLLKNLAEMRFERPTPIQSYVLPLSIAQRRDIIGAAETGSGKTLAYGLTIAHYILNHSEEMQARDRRLCALIVAPTRELALQIKDHIARVIQGSFISIGVIIGGLAKMKQQRVISSRPHIIVATPGRLFELISDGELYLRDLTALRFFIIDEADRMIQPGHFKELREILSLLPKATDIRKNASRKTQGQPNSGEEDESESRPTVTLTHRQTMLFSATLSLSEKTEAQSKGKSHLIRGGLKSLIGGIDFVDQDPQIVDLTKTFLVASGVVQTRVNCVAQEKDIYLYYFLLRYPGRTLVFLNSIDSVRRLVPLLNQLGLKVWPLHAQMEQRQRIKNVERFKLNDNCILVATDVAARGLDIPLVRHVVHFQVPKNMDTYVHRCGRTARNTQEGISMILVSPEELAFMKQLCNELQQNGHQLSEFPVEIRYMSSIKKRIQLATEIDTLEHRMHKQKSDNDWRRKAANELEIDLSEDEQVDGNSPDKRQRQPMSGDVHGKRLQLSSLLQVPLVPLGTSMKFITRNPTLSLPERLKATQGGGILADHPNGVQRTAINVARQSRKSK